MTNVLHNSELQSRISFALTGHRYFASAKVEKVTTAILSVFAILAVAGVLVACFFHGDAKTAQAWTLSLSALALQSLGVFMMGPAFCPWNTRNRVAQLYLPISNKQISEPWFGRMRIGVQCIVTLIVLMVVIGLICRVSFRWILTNALWQMVVLSLMIQAIYLVLGRGSRYGWFGTTFWWIAISLTALGLFSLQVLTAGAPALFAAPLLAVLKLPDWTTRLAGGDVSLAFSVAAFTCTCIPWSRKRWLGSPSYRQIRRVCRLWRTLPDRENPILENLNYPPIESKPARNGQPQQSLDRQIRSLIKRPHPLLLMPSATRRKATVYALLITLPYLALSVTTETLTAKAGFPQRTTLGCAVFAWHLPAIWGMVRLGLLTNSGLIHSGNAIRLAMRGMWIDTLTIAILCVPCVALIGHFTGDYQSSATHLSICLALGLMMRVLSSWLVWLPQKIFDVTLMSYTMMGAFIAGGIMGLSGEAIVLCTLGSVCTAGSIGWDRVAKHLHAPAKWVSKRWPRPKQA